MKGEYDGTKVLVWPLQIPSLFNHRCLTECMLLEETTSRHQWKIVYLTGKRGWDKSPSLSIFFGLSSKTQWLSGLYYADFISFYSPTQLSEVGRQNRILTNYRFLSHSLFLLFHFATFNNEIICFCSISVCWMKSFIVSFVEEVFFTKLFNVIINEIEEFFVSFLNSRCNCIWITK